MPSSTAKELLRHVGVADAGQGFAWSALVATFTVAAITVLSCGLVFATSSTARYLAAVNVVSISLDRSGCMGTCPSYRLTLMADGSATFNGNNFVRYGETYKTSTRSPWFPRFADVLYKLGMFVSRSPHSFIDDAEQTTVTIGFKRGNAATTSSYGDFLGEAQDVADDVYVSELAVDAIAGQLCGWHRTASQSANFEEGWYSPITTSKCPDSRH